MVSFSFAYYTVVKSSVLRDNVEVKDASSRNDTAYATPLGVFSIPSTISCHAAHIDQVKISNYKTILFAYQRYLAPNPSNEFTILQWESLDKWACSAASWRIALLRIRCEIRRFVFRCARTRARNRWIGPT